MILRSVHLAANPARYPIIVFDLHNVCNQTCSYCVAGSSHLNDFGPFDDPVAVDKIQKFFRSHGPFNIVLTGGEPLITPGVSDLFKACIDAGHIISLQTNLKKFAHLIPENIPVESAGWILTTFHSCEISRFKRFFNSVLQLKELGYPVVVKLVLDDVMVEHFEAFHDRFIERSIGAILSPLVIFQPAMPPAAQEYNVEQWRRIEPRINLRSTWLYFSSGFMSRGRTCKAGSMAFYARGGNGSINGCAHSYPTDLGNLFSNEFSPKSGYITCGIDHCICDFNYYTGTIPILNDNEVFQRVASGIFQPVSFEEYLEWVELGSIQPVIDLRPVIGQLRENVPFVQKEDIYLDAIKNI